jgi:hypothetical protein
MSKSKQYNYPCFVWVKGMNGPRAEIWYEDQYDHAKAVIPLARYELSEAELKYAFSMLERKYPPPKEAVN